MFGLMKNLKIVLGIILFLILCFGFLFHTPQHSDGDLNGGIGDIADYIASRSFLIMLGGAFFIGLIDVLITGEDPFKKDK
tara:strand:+ start:428 stop:667 length:240 start_codon:yes stop_codon:yes gene_type:complete